MHQPPSPCKKYCWYSFLLEAESTSGPQCGRKDYVNENSSDTIGNRTCNLPTCSAVPKPTAPLRHKNILNQKKNLILIPVSLSVSRRSLQSTTGCLMSVHICPFVHDLISPTTLFIWFLCNSEWKFFSKSCQLCLVSMKIDSLKGIHCVSA